MVCVPEAVNVSVWAFMKLESAEYSKVYPPALATSPITTEIVSLPLCITESSGTGIGNLYVSEIMKQV